MKSLSTWIVLVVVLACGGLLYFVFSIKNMPVQMPVLAQNSFTLPDASAPLVRCSHTLPYSLGTISSKFIEQGFDNNSLLPLIEYAAAQWNNGLGINILAYAPSSTNVINFVDSLDPNDYPGIITDKTNNGSMSGYTHRISYSDGTISFSLDISAATIDTADKTFQYYSSVLEGASLNTIRDNSIAETIMHEMGHAIGFPADHFGLVSPNMAIFGGNIMDPTGPVPSQVKPQLTNEDIALMKYWCQGNDAEPKLPIR